MSSVASGTRCSANVRDKRRKARDRWTGPKTMLTTQMTLVARTTRPAVLPKAAQRVAVAHCRGSPVLADLMRLRCPRPAVRPKAAQRVLLAVRPKAARLEHIGADLAGGRGPVVPKAPQGLLPRRRVASRRLRTSIRDL